METVPARSPYLFTEQRATWRPVLSMILNVLFDLRRGPSSRSSITFSILLMIEVSCFDERTPSWLLLASRRYPKGIAQRENPQ